MPRPQRSRGSSPGAGRRLRTSRCDNGPELTANALRDWCRFSGTGSSYIEPGAPWENPYVESFNGRLRDEFLGRRAVRQPARGAGAARGLADRVQHEAPAQQPGLARPGCLRPALGGSATRWTLISGGLAKGVRSGRQNLMRPTDTHGAKPPSSGLLSTRWLGIRCTGLRPSGESSANDRCGRIAVVVLDVLTSSSSARCESRASAAMTATCAPRIAPLAVR